MKIALLLIFAIYVVNCNAKCLEFQKQVQVPWDLYVKFWAKGYSTSSTMCASLVKNQKKKIPFYKPDNAACDFVKKLNRSPDVNYAIFIIKLAELYELYKVDQDKDVIYFENQFIYYQHLYRCKQISSSNIRNNRTSVWNLKLSLSNSASTVQTMTTTTILPLTSSSILNQHFDDETKINRTAVLEKMLLATLYKIATGEIPKKINLKTFL